MAKSIRSKWKRKCRAIKRERYAVKELARLKKTLGITDDDPNAMATDPIEPAAASENVIFLDANEVKKKQNKRKNKKNKTEIEDTEDAEMSSDDEKITVDAENGKKRIFSTKTLKDQNGSYPTWLHRRKIAKLTKSVKKTTNKRKQKKRNKK